MPDVPQCECGARDGLWRKKGRWWCPACLWKEIERLERALLDVAYQATKAAEGRQFT